MIHTWYLILRTRLTNMTNTRGNARLKSHEAVEITIKNCFSNAKHIIK